MVMEEKTSCNGTHQGDLWEDKRSLRVRGREKIWSRQEEKQKNIRGKNTKACLVVLNLSKRGVVLWAIVPGRQGMGNLKCPAARESDMLG